MNTPNGAIFKENIDASYTRKASYNNVSVGTLQLLSLYF